MSRSSRLAFWSYLPDCGKSFSDYAFRVARMRPFLRDRPRPARLPAYRPRHRNLNYWPPFGTGFGGGFGLKPS
jgi:hypothetical protein